MSTIDRSRMNVVVQQTSQRVTPPPAGRQFTEALAAGGQAVVRAAIAAASHIPGVDVAAAALRGAGVGEARDVASGLASWVREIAQDRSSDVQRPVALISGGECTVTVRGDGKGGRCSEYLLSMGLAVESLGVADRVYGVAADTDGIDGASEAAGALLTPTSLAQARALGVQPMRALTSNDALAVFEPLGLTLVTGPTRTNVNDYRAILVL